MCLCTSESSEKLCSVISQPLSVSFVEKSAECQLNVLLLR